MINDEHHQRRIKRARELRQTANSPEVLVWSVLRNRKLFGLRFRRQHPIGPYFGDFVCIECQVIVELDGESHVGTEAEDLKRDQYLERAGFRVYRIANHDVHTNLEGVALGIAKFCGKIPGPITPPLLPGEGAGG